MRARIVAALTATVGAAMLIVGLYSSWQLRGHLLQREDAELRAAAPTLVDSTIKQVEAAQAARVPSIIPTNVYAVRVVGDITRDFVPPQGGRPQFGTVTVESAKARANHPYTVDSADGTGAQWRMIQGIDAATGEPYAVAVSLRTMESVVRQMQLLLLGVSSATLILSVGVGLFAIRRAMRPLTDIEDTAAAIAAGDLSRRAPNPGSADEVESLAESLNVMLGRLENSIHTKERSEEGMRRFVADASHELRTPLATVRGYAELYRQGAMPNPENVAAGFRRIEDEANRMSLMVEDLLLLSRLETEQRAKSLDSAATGHVEEDIDLTVLVADAVADAGARAKDDANKRRFKVSGLNGPLAPVLTSGDEQRIRQVITNLLTNAERYTPVGSPVEVLVGAQDDWATIHVVDHGPGIPDDIRQRVFDRFYRVDVARNRAEGSTGLGLSIVAAIVANHEGEVDVVPTPGGGATFRVRLPLVVGTSESE